MFVLQKFCSQNLIKECTSELVKQKIDLTITKTTDGVVKAYSCDARVSIDSYFRCNSD